MLSTQQLTQFYGFVEDIRANPYDDSIKLIFADWLTDNELLTWADLIRSQMELWDIDIPGCVNNYGRRSPRLFVCEKDKEFWTTNKRLCKFCKLTEEENRCFWIYSLANSGRLNSTNMNRNHDWSRGFVYYVRVCYLPDWGNVGPVICDIHPVQGIICEQLTCELFDPAIGYQFLPVGFLPVYRELLKNTNTSDCERVRKLEKALINWAVERAQEARYVYVQE